MEGEQERELGMKQIHRNHILNNIESLIRTTNFNRIMDEAVRMELFRPKMRDIIETRNNMSEQNELAVRHEQHKMYFETITRRGPRAYDTLKEIFRRLHHLEALRILEAIEDETSGSPYFSLNGNRNNRNSQGYSNNNNNNSQGYRNSCNQGYTNNATHSSSSSSGVSSSCSSSSTDIVDTRIPITLNGVLVPYTKPVIGQTRVVIQSDRIHTDNVVGVYKMESQHDRGVLMIVNIIDFPRKDKVREGAEFDGDALIHIFRQMGFTVFYYVNLNHDEFFNALRTLTSSEYVERTECFAMVLMTHGERCNEQDRVVFTDGSVAEVRDILNHFQADNCPQLVNKPKVLIFPFCRGDRPDPGKPKPAHVAQSMVIQTDGTGYVDTPIANVPTLSDVMVCYASTAGWETHRDPETGTWYIQSFCDTMAQHAHDLSLEDIIKKTQAAVMGIRTPLGNLQTGEYNNIGFIKKLYFNPGQYVIPNADN